ncbi:unnamed protein product [Meganyctiphanes norvegica]|uniref:Fibrinogen C-terminal domain-containing protein n=1 Tax=Meganyctiphanes norvegica TaxID=48144 RepID=A0AAV2QQJ4_MEGNR
MIYFVIIILLAPQFGAFPICDNLVHKVPGRAPPRRVKRIVEDSTTKVLTTLQDVKDIVLQEIKQTDKERDSVVENVKESIDHLRQTIDSIAHALDNLGIQRLPQDCQDLHHSGRYEDGVYTIFPNNNENDPVRARCDMEPGRGWTVMLDRHPHKDQVHFNRKWNNYRDGFGNPKGEHWLGLESLHWITQRSPQLLRIDLEDWDGNQAWAEYKGLWIETETSKYALHIGDYDGNAGDCLQYHNGQSFSTYDQDNDDWEDNCASSRKGGFWYKSCHYTNPTGVLTTKKDYTLGMIWFRWKSNITLKKILFKIRPE